MIVSVVSMPEGTVTSASLTEARQLLATGSFVVVDVEQPEQPTSDDQGVARQLGLDAERLAWLGRPAEDVRADYDGEIAGFVAPVVEGDRVTRVHAVATERYLVTAHRGPVGLIETLVGRVPHDRPSDPMAALFLLVEAAVKTFGRLAQRGVQEVETLRTRCSSTVDNSSSIASLSCAGAWRCCIARFCPTRRRRRSSSR